MNVAAVAFSITYILWLLALCRIRSLERQLKQLQTKKPCAATDDCQESTTFEASVFVGSRRGLSGPEFAEDELVAAVGRFQHRSGQRIPVRVSPTRFVDFTYDEPGFEVTAVCYPGYPHGPDEVEVFVRKLAEFLLEEFGQDHTTVKTSSKTWQLRKTS